MINSLRTKFFLIFLVFIFSNFSYADSAKIYNKKYQNPVSVLNSFLWKDDSGGYIGLTSRVFVQKRNLNNSIHPVSIDSIKIKVALSKLKYKNIEKTEINDIFNADNLEILSKNISKGLLIANNSQDVTFQLVNKNDELVRITKGIVFVEKNSLNLVFYKIHDCEIILKSKKRGFYRRSQIFPKKNVKCEENKKKVLVSSNLGIYKKNINPRSTWLIFTPQSFQVNSIN